MNYAIVYTSKTGNTRLLAETIASMLPSDSCLYCGSPDDRALDADQIYVGFWTDKGSCDEEVAAFLSRITTQKVFLFGTAGFGGDPAYFSQLLDAVRTHLPAGAEVIGSYMCQGKMLAAVRARYESMPDSPKKQEMLDNFDRALSHPNGQDLDALRRAVLSTLS